MTDVEPAADGPADPEAGADGAQVRGGVRRRRRAVGPPGALPGRPLDAVVADRGPPPAAGGPGDDARLLADVPPHHGAA